MQFTPHVTYLQLNRKSPGETAPARGVTASRQEGLAALAEQAGR